jgi:hypothetical protein
VALDPVTAVLDVGGKLIDRLWPDPATRDAAKLEMFKAQQAGELQESTQVFTLMQAQATVDAAEAANSNVFVAGWRPFVGWVCGAGFAVEYVVGPLVEWLAALFGHPTKFPQLDGATLMGLLTAMLGLGAYRTVEKVKGVGTPMN